MLGPLDLAQHGHEKGSIRAGLPHHEVVALRVDHTQAGLAKNDFDAADEPLADGLLADDQAAGFDRLDVVPGHPVEQQQNRECADQDQGQHEGAHEPGPTVAGVAVLLRHGAMMRLGPGDAVQARRVGR